MKIPAITLILILIYFSTLGQISKSGIFGSWIKFKVVYNSGEDLPLNSELNQSYLRIEFKLNDKAIKALQPLDNEYIFDYSLSGNSLKIGLVNYQIKYLSKDTLILIERGPNGFDDFAIKYFFISEKSYQSNIPLTSDMIIVSGKDSIYIENEKIRAHFNKDQSFKEFLIHNIPAYNQKSTDDYFMATFIIASNGSIDSIKIHKGMNKAFDSQFVKAVNKSTKYWESAKYNDKRVSVLHTEFYQFISYTKFKTQYFNFQDGVIAIQRGDYAKAITNFNKCIESNPEDKDALYQRGLCFYELKEYDKACIDWNKVKELKSNQADKLLNQLCR